MVLRVYNTIARTLEQFKPLRERRVTMFVCGPTVYDYSHIGHARTYLAYDIIVRYLRARGFTVFYLMNITDVDDKIIARANATGEDPLVLADRFAKEFFRDMEALGITSANFYAKASEHIPEMVAQISTLIQKGYAYEVDGDVYFEVSKFPEYGALSRQKIEQLVMHRIDPDPRKKNVVDFSLWKKQKPNEPAWDSPWGKGRPGWHIEDTAITNTYFGPTYDLHGGGQDLIFPHHEAEIAQAEAATGVKPLARYWLHAGLLAISGTRMGKSMGNFITIKDALQKHEAEALRLYCAMSHYRSQLEFDEPNIGHAEQVLDRLRSVYNQFGNLFEASSLKANKTFESNIVGLTSRAMDAFVEAMDNDFNTPRALAAMIGYAKDVEPYLTKGIGRESIEHIAHAFEYFGGIFGILQSREAGREKILEGIIRVALELREDARKRGDYGTSDKIRDRLAEIGIVLEDTLSGARWYLSSSKPLKESS